MKKTAALLFLLGSMSFVFSKSAGNLSFNDKGFGIGNTFEKTWIVSSTMGNEPELSNGTVTFYYEYQSDASLSRKFVISKDCYLTYDVEPGIYSAFDGYLDFYINGSKVDSFTGNGGKRSVHYLLKKGKNDIKWVQNDSKASATNSSSYDLTVKLSNLKIIEAKPDMTLSEGFGKGPEFSYDWILNGNITPEFENTAEDGSAAIKVNYKEMRESNTTLTRPFEAKEKSLISFNVKTNLHKDVDGYVDFYIDGIKQDSYTGTNKNWINYVYEINKGRHELSWNFVGTSNSYYPDCIAWLSNLKIENMKEPDLLLNNGFGKDNNLSYDWTVKGSKKPVLVNGSGVNKAVSLNFQKLRTETIELSRAIEAPEPSVIKFQISTDINPTYDGFVEFYIDGKKQESYTGEKTERNASFYVDKGKHNILWKFVGVESGWTSKSSITWDVTIDNLAMKSFNVPATLNETFDSVDSSLITGSGRITKDKVLSKWSSDKNRAPGMLNDTHGNVYELGLKKDLTLSMINAERTSALSFDYKSDVFDNDVLKVYVDGVEQAVRYGGSSKEWENVSILLPAGLHTIKLENTQHSVSPQVENVIYIDNITLAEDVTASVDIYPKGLQETYVNGTPIQFTGKALRADGTVRKNVKVNYTTNGGVISSSGLFKPAGRSGVCTVRAYADGKKADNNTVKIHGADYLKDPVTINGYTFKGGTEKSADGFFVMEGKADTAQLIKVKKNGTYFESNFLVREKGPFKKRIWLRFGPGDYTVIVYSAPYIKFFNPGDSRYEGDVNSYGLLTEERRFTVTNTSKAFSEKEAIWLMPSDVAQSDNFIVSNLVHGILGELPENATLVDKIRAFHNWEVYTHYYDVISRDYPGRRKRQDAVSVIKYGTAVCDGYANLFAALLRSIGVQTRIFADTSINHTWNYVLHNNGKWYLVDATWDDPIPVENNIAYDDVLYGREKYTYFMTSLKDKKHIHYEPLPDFSHSSYSDNDFDEKGVVFN